MKKDKKLTTLVVTLAIAATMALGMCLIGCNEVPEYTVSFTGGGTLVSGTAPASLKKKEGDIITLPDNTFTYEGHTFAGWSYADEIYAVGDEFTVAKSDAEFTAVWNVAKVSITYVGGTGAEGTAPEATSKEVGSKFELAENTFTKDGFVFVGWKSGNDIYDVGEEIDVAASDMTFTAVWGTEYVNNSDSMITSAIFASDDSIFAAVYDGYYKAKTYYRYSVADNTYTFTSMDGENTSYEGTIINDTIIAALPASTGYAPVNHAFILTQTKLTPDPITGTNEYVQSEDIEAGEKWYMFTNKVIVYTKGWQTSEIKAGTYALKSGLYEVTYIGDTTATKFKIENKGGVAFISLCDKYVGEYTLNSDTVNLDGFGEWDNGTYIGFSNDAETIIYLNDSDNAVSYVCNIAAGNVLTPLSNVTYKQYGVGCAITNIYYNNGTLVGLSGAYANVSATLESKKTSLDIRDYYYEIVYDSENDQFNVTAESLGEGGEENYYFTKNGKKPVVPGLIEIEDGNYVNSTDSAITASILTTDGVQALSLTKSGRTATYAITCYTNRVTFTEMVDGEIYPGTKEINGTVINGVIVISGIKAGSSSCYVVLSKTALTPIDITAAAGYFKTSASANYKLFMYNNNVVVFQSYSSGCRAGTFVVGTGDSEYDITYTYNIGSASPKVTFKLFADDGSVAAHYVEKDKVFGSYTVSGNTIVLDGYGVYTKGSETGKYIAGPNGFTILADANEIGKKYSIGSGNVLEEVTVATATEATNKGGNTFNYLEKGGIAFGNDLKVYVGTGCAEVSYTYNESVTNVSIVVGTTFTIENVTFTVTEVTDDSCIIKAVGSVNIEQTDGTTKKQTINGSMTWSTSGAG